MNLHSMPASGYSVPDLIQFLNQGFEDYSVPIQFNTAAFLSMLRKDGLDLTASRVLTVNAQPCGIALIARRGWTLTAIESGLNGILARKIPHTASFSNLNPASLMDAVRAARANSHADIALGVSVYPEDRSAEMAMITPRGEKTHHITYGGPPRSLPHWAMNLALNWLRMTVEELD